MASDKDGKTMAEKLEYAIDLIETVNAKEKSPIEVVRSALTIMDFGQLSIQDMLKGIEAQR